MSTQTVPRWTFADRLRKARRDNGLSQHEFAALIGVGEKALASWEAGSNTPRDIVAVARAVEDQLGIPAAWTLGLSLGSEHTDRYAWPLGA